MVLICIFLMISHVEHLFKYLVFQVLGKVFIQVLCLFFLIGLFVLFVCFVFELCEFFIYFGY